MWYGITLKQGGADYSDPSHPMPAPWYLEKSCSAAQDENYFYCWVAKASYITSIMMVYLYVIRFALNAMFATMAGMIENIRRPARDEESGGYTMQTL